MTGNIRQQDIADVSQALVLSMLQDSLTTTSILAPTFQNISNQARPGIKSIGIPDTGDLEALNKAAQTPGTKQRLIFSPDTLNLEDYKQVLVRLEDIANIQSEPNVPAAIARKASEAMVRAIESDTWAAARDGVSASTPNHVFGFSGGSGLEAGQLISKEDILRAREALNKANVSMADRFLAVPPRQERALLSIPEFIKANEYGSQAPIQNGELGQVFGFRVVMSTTVDEDHALFYNRGHLAWAMQQDPKFEVQRAELEHLADDYSLSALYGHRVLKGGVKAVLFGEAYGS